MSNGRRRSVQQMFADAANSINKNAASAYDYFNQNRAVFPRRGRTMPRQSGIGTIPFDVGLEADNARSGGMSEYQIQAMLARAKRPGLPISPNVMASVQRPPPYDPTSDFDNMARYGTAQFLNNPPPVYSMSTEGRPTPPLVADREKDVSPTAEQVLEKTGFMPRAEAATKQNMGSERRAGPPMSRVPAADLGVTEQGMTRMPQPAPAILAMEDAMDIGDGGGRLPRRGPPMARAPATKMLPKRRLTPSRDAVMPGDMSGASAEELDAAAQKGSELDIDAPQAPAQEAESGIDLNTNLMKLGLQITAAASKPGATFMGSLATGALNHLNAEEKRELIKEQREFKRELIKSNQRYESAEAKLERGSREKISAERINVLQDQVKARSLELAETRRFNNEKLRLQLENLPTSADKAAERNLVESKIGVNNELAKYHEAKASGVGNELAKQTEITKRSIFALVEKMIDTDTREYRSAKGGERAKLLKRDARAALKAIGLVGSEIEQFLPGGVTDLSAAGKLSDDNSGAGGENPFSKLTKK